MLSDPRFSRRFTLSLAAALALHGLALYGLRLPAPARFAKAMPLLEITLTPAVPAALSEIAAAAPRRSTPILAGAAVVAREPALPQNVGGQPAELPPAESARETPPTIANPAWRETARAVIREEAHRLPDGAAPAPPETLEARFARALRKTPPGEKRLADGIIKITSPSGAIYCIQSQPDATRDGPGERYAITVTCP